MNDPHVATLLYRLEHGDHVDFANARPLTIDMEGFRVDVAGGSAQITMKSHFATKAEAQFVVEPFLRAWELDLALRYGPQTLEFVYVNSEIIDRKPSQGNFSMNVEPISYKIEPGPVSLRVGFAEFPRPTSELLRSPVVEMMFARYCPYRRGQTTVADAAYFCLTCLEYDRGDRLSAANYYKISSTVLGKLGALASIKGGPEARKAEAHANSYTGAERQWLEEAIKLLIRRAAEAATPNDSFLPEITMGDLPSLS